MRGTEFLDKMELVNSEFIEEAGENARKSKKSWVKWSVLAACLAVAVTAFLWPKEQTVEISLGGIPRVYQDTLVAKSETARVWPWDSMTLQEQYTKIFYNEAEYSSRNQAVSPEFLGEHLATVEATATDFTTGTQYNQNFDLYAISGIDPNLMVAADFQGEFSVFHRDGYAPPATWGELLTEYGLAQNLELEQFTAQDGDGQELYLALDGDDPIWDILSACPDAPFVEETSWGSDQVPSVSFTATSQPLGVYKRFFKVSADGYLRTNLFDYGYAFDLGGETAQKIISNATEQATQSAPAPYMQSLAGTVVEIGDGFILVDDAIRCANPKDALQFQVPTTDLQISRVITAENLSVGDVVVVDFLGEIGAGNLVANPFSLSKGILTQGEIAVLE